jgi:hypothetical protein
MINQGKGLTIEPFVKIGFNCYIYAICESDARRLFKILEANKDFPEVDNLNIKLDDEINIQIYPPHIAAMYEEMKKNFDRIKKERDDIATYGVTLKVGVNEEGFRLLREHDMTAEKFIESAVSNIGEDGFEIFDVEVRGVE